MPPPRLVPYIPPSAKAKLGRHIQTTHIGAFKGVVNPECAVCEKLTKEIESEIPPGTKD